MTRRDAHRAWSGPAALALTGLLLSGASAHAQAGGDKPPPYQAPPVPELAPVAIELHADRVIQLNGPGSEDDEVLPAGPYPLVTALRRAAHVPDPVIGVHGEIPGLGIQIGAGDSDAKGYVVHWGPTPMRFALVGRTSDARIREFTIRSVMNDGTRNGGVEDVRFQDLTIEARYTSCVSTPKGDTFGLLRFYGCRFAAGRENLAQGAYEGRGYKWGVRSQGRGRWDFRHCTFEPVLEHCLYLDSPQGDCCFVDLQHTGSTRTAIQIVNRCFDNPGPSGFGTLLFEDVRIQDLWGDGGSGITVAGHLGDLVFRAIQARENPERPGSHGLIAVWTDASSDHGAYLSRGADGELHSTGVVTVEALDSELPRCDRPQVAISGAESVSIRGFDIRGNQAAFAFDSPFGSARVRGRAVVDGEVLFLEDVRISNGQVEFQLPAPLSAYPGWGSTEKIRIGTQTLTDEEIDRAWSGG